MIGYFAEIHPITILTTVAAIGGCIILLGLLVAGAGFLWQSFRNGKDQRSSEDVARQARLDKTLQDLVDAQEKRYLQLEHDRKEDTKEISKLTGIVEEQRKQQEWFKAIFVSALTKFFQDNPELAVELDGKFKKQK